uniref:Reverse transcriptase Ty1/copia-type domain-containing protein n=1 Tax=Nicotiana tabacum TaxID=4097 RepID=A0A1S3ZHD0_TOBAC|nr:PREDICTED: uncharacterized protein LOC107786726 [Nicotiana tabacum]
MVERKHKYLLETARALLFQSKLPLKFWGEYSLDTTNTPLVPHPDSFPSHSPDSFPSLSPELQSSHASPSVSPPPASSSESPPPEHAPTLRRYQREHHLPSHLQDYVCFIPKLSSDIPATSSSSLAALFSLHHISPESLVHDSHSFVMNDLVPLPSGKKAIDCRWVYKVKHKADGSIERFKARLVVKGYTQQTGVDYTETFSPAVKLTAVRAHIATAVKRKWIISQLDINNAFLHRDLHEEVYMEIPPGIEVPTPCVVCRLNKSLYGLKQASRQWYAKLAEALYSRGYVHSLHDYSLFCKRTNSSTMYIDIYVDDVLIIGTDMEEVNQLKSFLHNTFKIKDMDKLHYFLGLEVIYKTDGVLISQRKFALDLLKEYDCMSYSGLSSPLDPSIQLQAKDPREPHLKVVFHLLRYLRSDPTLGIFFSNDPDCTTQAYCDSDWAACPDSRRKDKDLEQHEPVMLVLLNHHRLLKQQLNNQVLQVILELPGPEILNHQLLQVHM